MKKFLTVLLALSVVFTYTVGTAFALPSDETTEAGLKAAQAEAISELNSYKDLSDYSATDQVKMGAIIAEYADLINDAQSVSNYTRKIDGKAGEKTADWTAIAGKTMITPGAFYSNAACTTSETGPLTTDTAVYYKAKGVQTLLSDAKTSLDSFQKTADQISLEDAKKNSIAQFEDYVYLIDNAKTLGFVDDDATKEAKIGYNTYSAFKTASEAAINAATDVEGVEEALNTALAKADKIYALLEEVEVSQTDIDNLVKKIRATAASYKVSTATHSSAVVAAYEQAIEDGVAAAKSVKTWKDYYQVYDKYVGNGAATVTVKNGVFPRVSTVSEFAKYKFKTLDVEKRIAAVEKLLKELGEYNWKEYAQYGTNTDSEDIWEDVEELYYQANYYIENGTFKGTPGSGKAVSALTAMISSVNKNSNTNAVNTEVAKAASTVRELTVLGQTKTTLIRQIQSYVGSSLNGATPTLQNYDSAEQRKIESLQISGEAAILNAGTVAEAQSAYDNFVKQIDDVNTRAETKFEGQIAEYNDLIDQYVKDNLNPNTIGADQKILVEKFVQALKDQFATQTGAASAQVPNTVATESIKNTTNAPTLDDVVKGIDKSVIGANAARIGYSKYAVKTATYNTTNDNIVDVLIKNFNPNDYSTWEAFFEAYDDLAAKVDKVPTKAQEDYTIAVSNANKAIAALGTPALTSAFKDALDAADNAYSAYVTAKVAFDALDADEQAEVTAKLTDEAKYLDAKAEYERLAYLDGKVEAATTNPVVDDFFIIANSYLNKTNIKGCFNSAGNQEIAKIISDTYDAIKAAKTTADQTAAALEGVEKLASVALDNSGDQDLIDLLTAVKADAAKYFTKYYNAAFTSDATTKIDLVKDIIEFNEKLLPDPSADALKAEVKGTHMKIGSSAAKGYIKISWKASNTTVTLDGVEVYRSTKKTSGFKKISTFKVQTSKKYTTNLTKGTKYYYYVKGYKMVGDEKVYTHDSITVGRTFRK